MPATLGIDLVPLLSFFSIQQKLPEQWSLMTYLTSHSASHVGLDMMCQQPTYTEVDTSLSISCTLQIYAALCLNLRTSTHVRHLHVDVAAKTTSILCNFITVFCFHELNCHQFSCICHTFYDISFQEANSQAA
jgi:hypothetical protein